MLPELPRPTLTLALPTLLAAIGLFGTFSVGHAQEDADDEARQRWVFEGELTSVLSRGNSENLALGFGATTRRRWEKDALRFEAAWVQVETGRITVRAVGTADDFDVQRDVDREKTAESIAVRARYDRTLTERVFVYGGVDWLRNTFAGIDSRTLIAVGGGNTWLDGDRTRFSTDYAVTYTFEEDVVENPFLDSDFAGVRFGYELWRRLSENAVFESELIADLNLQETEDRRFDLENSMTVDINDVIALKPSLRFSWRNLPALRAVPLFTPAGEDTGTTVQSPLRKLDTLFRLALVLTL
jgi:putative salt-induced outer membrane protein YdiY